MKIRVTSLVFIIASLVTYLSNSAASGQQIEPKSSAKVSTQPQVLDWLAFGSGCQGSKDKPSGDVVMSHNYQSSLLARLYIQKLSLNLSDKKQGLSECAVRISVQPPNGQRVRHVAARTTLSASKNENFHLRARLLLLVGQITVDSYEWDLPDKQFARGLEQLILLSAGKKTELAMPLSKCGAAQIIGLDYTFEGLRKTNNTSIERLSDEIWLRTIANKEKDSAQIEVFFEKCF